MMALLLQIVGLFFPATAALAAAKLEDELNRQLAELELALDAALSDIQDKACTGTLLTLHCFDNALVSEDKDLAQMCRSDGQDCLRPGRVLLWCIRESQCCGMHDLLLTLTRAHHQQAYNKAFDLYNKLFDDLLNGRAVSLHLLDVCWICLPGWDQACLCNCDMLNTLLMGRDPGQGVCHGSH